MTQQPSPTDSQWVDECYVVTEETYRYALPNGTQVDLCAEPVAACPTEEIANAVADRMLANFHRERPDYPHKVAYTVSRVPILTH